MSIINSLRKMNVRPQSDSLLTKSERLKSSVLKTSILAIIAIGLLIRIIQYLVNRSIWLDEAMLALNIMEKNVFQLFGPLDRDQAAPYLFLLVEKILSILFGSSEFVLRFFPLLSSITALITFVFIANRLFEAKYSLIPILLFCFSSKLIYYAQEVKPYSSDVATALILFVAYLRFGSEINIKKKNIFILSVLGVFALWFSYPAMFVLGGIGGAMLIEQFITSDKKNIKPLLIILFVWTINIIVLYFLQFKSVSNNERLSKFWDEGFLHFPLNLDNLLIRFFQYSDFGYPIVWLVGFFVLIGIADIFLKKHFQYLPLIFTFCLLLFFAALHKYPFSDRCILFAMPFLYLLIGIGIVATVTNKHYIYLIILAPIICFPFLQNAYAGVREPILREEIRPLIYTLNKEKKKDDITYVYYGAYWAFKYYQELLNLDDKGLLRGLERRGDTASLKLTAQKISEHPRAWLLFTHTMPGEDIFILQHLKGKCEQHFTTNGADLYLCVSQ